MILKGETMEANRLLIAAGRFHGHIGPFLAVGLKIGLVANEILGRSPLEVRAEVEVNPRPPRSCVIDGIQYVTGCTLGKANIVIHARDDRIAASFSLGGRSVRISLRDEFLKEMESSLQGKPEKAVVDYAFQIMDTPAEQFLEVLQ